jgi:hypothetical protein
VSVHVRADYFSLAGNQQRKYFRNAVARDAGLRIDHLLLSPAVAGRLVAAGVDREVCARERSSDHAPVWIELADMGARARDRRPVTRVSSRRSHRSSGSITHLTPQTD